MVNSGPKINPAVRYFENALEEISSQTSRLKKLNLRFIDVPPMANLRRFKVWKFLPEEFVEELGHLFQKHGAFLHKIGINKPSELLQQEWLHRFFRWEVKTNAQSHSNQKKSFGGVLLEKKVLNDPELSLSLSQSAESLLVLMKQELNEGLRLSPLPHKRPVSPDDLAVVRATDFIDMGGRPFLDFGYLFVSGKGQGKTAIPAIEGQIKSDGVVHKYYYGQGDRDTGRFPMGFSCMIKGQRRTFEASDILVDESFEGGVGKALIHPDAHIKATGWEVLPTKEGRLTIDITYKTETQDIQNFMNDLYIAKSRALEASSKKAK